MSTILINLLPDVRQAKLREKHYRQLAGAIMTLVVIVSGGALILGVGITQAQNLRIHSLTNTIASDQTSFNNTPNINDILTVQRNLQSLSTLYSQRVYVSKFFAVLSSVDPSGVLINTLKLDPTNVLTVQAQARSYAEASKLAQAMAASNVTIGPNHSSNNTPDFTNVTLSSLAADNSGHIGFTIRATVSPGVTSHGN